MWWFHDLVAFSIQDDVRLTDLPSSAVLARFFACSSLEFSFIPPILKTSLFFSFFILPFICCYCCIPTRFICLFLVVGPLVTKVVSPVIMEKSYAASLAVPKIHALYLVRHYLTFDRNRFYFDAHHLQWMRYSDDRRFVYGKHSKEKPLTVFTLENEDKISGRGREALRFRIGESHTSSPLANCGVDRANERLLVTIVKSRIPVIAEVTEFWLRHVSFDPPLGSPF